MRLDKHLPPNAIQVRYVHPYYEGVYDDEDNFVEEYCTNESTATDVYKLIRKAHREKQSYYYLNTISRSGNLVAELSLNTTQSMHSRCLRYKNKN